MNTRKIIIAAIALVGVLGIYLLTTSLTGTSELPKQDLSKTPLIDDANKAETMETIGVIGDLSPGQVTQSRYTIRDPQTKEVKRVFGFSKLLRQAGDNWDIEKPYMKMFETSYTVELTSDTGTVEIEMVANQPTPKDARLLGNVVVELAPTAGSSAAAGKIYLDDVVFSSNNSQFSTDGPVRFISKDAEMVGTGMQLIYNGLDQRIEFLRIIDLEFIHIKEYKNKTSPTQSGNQIVSETDDGGKVTDSEITNDNEVENREKKQRYRCVVNDDVVIKYGTQHIYSDEVTLSNILFSGSKSKPSENNQKNVKSNVSQKSQNSISEQKKSNLQSQQEFVDIFITCKGGITLRPMDYYKNLQQAQIQSSRTIEFKGQPVQIKIENSSSSTEQIADCGFLKFDIDQEILDMTSYRAQRHVSLNFKDAGAKLKTEGSVHWQKRNNIAVINGPGKILMNEKSTTQAGQSGQNKLTAELDFMGMMKLYFVDADGASISTKQKIRLVDFLGGLDARIFDRNQSKLNADSARLIFDGQNQIAHAELDGNVKVNSVDGDVESSRAKIFFADASNNEKKVEYIELIDNVRSFSKGKTKTDMRADFTKLHFDQSEELVKADLQGNVVVSADQRYLYTQKMEVDFETDANGQSVPKTAKSLSTAQITSETKDASSFWAKEIEYDFTKGSAVAKGPVKFEFYTQQDKIENVPVVITAKRQAIFNSAKNKIRFVDNVVGKMIQEQNEQTRISDFTGDELVVDLNSRTVGQSDIKHIQINGQRVMLKNVEISDNEITNQIVLFCKKLDYFAEKGEIVADGGEGASEIQIDNSKAVNEQDKTGKISLEKACFARIMYFDKLIWKLEENQVIADGNRQRLYAGYVPVLADGSTGQPTRVNAGKIVANFKQTAAGRNEISTLTASNGISYEDSKYQFQGGEMFYETGSSFVRITGSRGFDAMFNGVKVGVIEYNLDSGKASYEMGQSGGMLY